MRCAVCHCSGHCSGPSPKSCAPVLCDSISYVEEPRAYLCVHKKHNTHRSMTSSPATSCRWGRGYAELRLNGVLESSSCASNPKQRQIYDVCGMCQIVQACYRASQQEERSEAPKYAPQKGHPWGVRSQWCNRLYCAEIPYGVPGEEGVLSWSVCAFRLLPDACLFARTLLGETTAREERTRDSHE